MIKCKCCQDELIKDDIALCKKILGRSTITYFCRRHLAEKLNVSETLLTQKITLFKEEGCTLFF